MAAHQALPSLGFSRQEHWSRLPFPSPMHESEKWKWSRSVVSDSSRRHKLQPTRLLCPWDSAGKSGVPLPSIIYYIIYVVVIQLLSHVWLFRTLWTAALQASLSFTISLNLLKLMSIESAMSSIHLILCQPLVPLPSVSPSVRVFFNIYICIYNRYIYI